MKNFLGFIVIIFYALSAQAQHKLQGNVKDKASNQNIAGAIIYLSDLKRIAKADSFGNYIFNNLPKGNYLLQIHAFSYSAHNQHINLDNDTFVQIYLEETHTELNEVVITGVSQATELRKSPIPVAILNHKQLLAIHSSNLMDAISHVPGVQTISTGAAIAKPVIRGLGYNRVITLYDGMRQEGQQWGDEHGIEIDEYGVSRIEIIKGPASLMYGSDGLAGVINILSAKPLPEGKKEGKLFLTQQSNNGLTGASLNLAANTGKLYWDMRAGAKIAGSYHNKYDGYVYNSAFNEWNAAGGIGINRSWGYSHLSATTFYQNIGLPEGERDSSGNFLAIDFLDDTTTFERAATTKELRSRELFYPKQSILHNRLLWSNNFLIGKGRAAVNIGYQENHRKEYEEIAARNDDAPAPALYMKLQTWNYDIKYFLAEKKGFQTSVGINGMYQRSRNKAEEYIIPDFNLADAGIYTYTKKSFGKTNISGGLRLDWRNIKAQELYINETGSPTTNDDTTGKLKFEALNNTFLNFSGSVGATREIHKNVLLKANVARGFRAPNIAELSANGIHEGTFRYEIGNINLKPETSLQGDIGLNINTNHFTFETAVFRNQIDQYIYLAKIPSTAGGDSIPDEEEGAPAFGYKQGNAVLYGGEIMMDIHPHPFDWLHFQNTFSYVRGTLQNQPDSLHDLPFMPPAVLQSEIRATRKKINNYLQNASVELELVHYFRQDKILKAYGTETETPGYNLLNASISTEVYTKLGKQLATVYFLAGNITNTAYQHHLSRLKYAPQNTATGRTGIYNMGRNFSIKLEIPLYSN